MWAQAEKWRNLLRVSDASLTRIVHNYLGTMHLGPKLQ